MHRLEVCVRGGLVAVRGGGEGGGHRGRWTAAAVTRRGEGGGGARGEVNGTCKALMFLMYLLSSKDLCLLTERSERG